MTSDQRSEMEMQWRVKQATHLPVGVGPAIAKVTPRLTGTHCYRCTVALTDGGGEAARWSSYAAASPEVCRACCRALERDAMAQEMKDREQWPSPHWGRIRYLLEDRGWRSLKEVYPDKRWDFFTACGRWVVQWERGCWVLAEAPDYDDLVERARGETPEELLAAMREWEVGR